MTACTTGVMRLRIRAYQRRRIAMTAVTVCSCYLDQGSMIRRIRCMCRLPTRGMTRLAVAANTKGLADCIVDQCTGAGVMAVRAVSQMRGCIDKRISMTAGAVIAAGCCHQAAVIRRRYMERVPGRTVTRCTVAAGTE